MPRASYLAWLPAARSELGKRSMSTRRSLALANGTSWARTSGCSPDPWGPSVLKSLACSGLHRAFLKMEVTAGGTAADIEGEIVTRKETLSQCGSAPGSSRFCPSNLVPG